MTKPSGRLSIALSSRPRAAARSASIRSRWRSAACSARPSAPIRQAEPSATISRRRRSCAIGGVGGRRSRGSPPPGCRGRASAAPRRGPAPAARRPGISTALPSCGSAGGAARQLPADPRLVMRQAGQQLAVRPLDRERRPGTSPSGASRVASSETGTSAATTQGSPPGRSRLRRKNSVHSPVRVLRTGPLITAVPLCRASGQPGRVDRRGPVARPGEGAGPGAAIRAQDQHACRGN